MVKLIIRDKDIISGSRNLEELHSIREYPVFMGCVDQDFESDLRFEQTWEISKETGIIQLKKLIPLDCSLIFFCAFI